jgi:hypothetical protein
MIKKLLGTAVFSCSLLVQRHFLGFEVTVLITLAFMIIFQTEDKPKQ